MLHHCPGDSSSADLFTRGISTKRLKARNMRWQGPNSLQFQQDFWPQDSYEYDAEGDLLQEQKARCLYAARSVTTPLFNITRLSSLTKLLNVTAWIIQFRYNARRSHHKIERPLQSLQSAKLEVADNYWIS